MDGEDRRSDPTIETADGRMLNMPKIAIEDAGPTTAGETGAAAGTGTEFAGLVADLKLTVDMAMEEADEIDDLMNTLANDGLIRDAQRVAIDSLTAAINKATEACGKASRSATTLSQCRGMRRLLIERRSRLFEAAGSLESELRRITVSANGATLNSSVQTSRAGPKKPTMPIPGWNGKVSDFSSWRREVARYFRVFGIEDDGERLLYLNQPHVLKAEAELAVRGCQTEPDFWLRLEERFTAMEVANDVTRILRELEPITKKQREDMNRVLGGISDYILRMEDNGRAAQLSADLVVNEAVEKLGFYAESFPDWMAMRFPKTDWDLYHVQRFLRERIANLALRTRNQTIDRQRGPGVAKTHQPTSERPTETERTATTGGRASKGGDPRPPRTNQNSGRPAHFDERNEQRPSNRFNPRVNATGPVEGTAAVADEEPSQPEETLGGKLRRNVRIPSLRATEVFGISMPTFSPTTFTWTLSDQNERVKLITLIDEGSDVTLLTRKTALRLGLELGNDFDLVYKVVGGTVTQRASKTLLEVFNYDGRSWVFEVVVIDEITGSSIPFPKNIWEECPHLTPLRGLVPERGENIDLLVGYAQKALTVPLQTLTPPCPYEDELPTGLKSALGWTVFGPVQHVKRPLPAIRTTSMGDDEKLTNLFSKWSAGETLGVEPTSLCACKPSMIEESAFMKSASDHVRRAENGRMEVRLPWKEGFPQCLPNNRHVAKAALNSLAKTLSRQGLESQYAEEMERIIRDYAEEVPPEEMDQPCWYLQHFLVQNRTKLRVVWNSAAKFEGFSLNLGLEKGPNLLNDITDVLWLFRKDRIAFLGDVEKMFNQVQLVNEDRDFHRFLWRSKDYRWCRLPFGDKSAPDLSIYCLHFLAEEHALAKPEGARTLLYQTYMDDIAGSAPTKEIAEVTISEIDEILASGSFRVKHWSSNEPSLDQTDESTTTILGVHWDKHNDTLSVRLEEGNLSKHVTRRIALSEIARVWDPLGILAATMTGPKILLQKMWDTHIDWDTPLTKEQSEDWRESISVLNGLDGVCIPRMMGKPEGGAKLHIFCDASLDAYGAVMWLVDASGNRSFVMAKTMVAPLKTRTIPRLELLSAQLATRMLRKYRATFGEVQATIWSDSKVVLHWVKMGARRFKAFVAARIQEIKENIGDDPTEFRHIAGELNPADALTKVAVVGESDLRDWLEGPDIESLIKNCPHDANKEECLPEQELSPDEMKRYTVEMKTEKARRAKKKQQRPRPLVPQVAKVVCQKVDLETEATKAGSWTNLLAKTKELHHTDEAGGLVHCLMHAQNKLDKKGLQKDPSGLYRMQGRLGEADVPEEVSHPVLLDGGSEVAFLLAKATHEECGHPGQKYLVNYLHSRKGVRVTKAKSIFRRIRETCETCQRMRGKRHTPQMANLPAERLMIGQPPFTAVGIDFVGGLNTVDGAKLEVLLFTCLTTRVVHLEVVDGKGTEDVLKGWTRFTLRRGVVPSYVLSDAAPSFKSARARIIRSNQTNPLTSLVHRLNWEIALPRAPHRRGAIEAMVKIFRRVLAGLKGNLKPLPREEWDTVIVEVNFLMNERPLIDSREPDKVTSFTGNSILYPYGESSETGDVNKIFQSAKENTKIIWEEWYSNKPPEMFNRTKWKENLPNVKVGDRVLIVKQGYGNDARPRKYWPTGVIVKVNESRDGIVRKVEVENENGKISREVVQNLVIISDVAH